MAPDPAPAPLPTRTYIRQLSHLSSDSGKSAIILATHPVSDPPLLECVQDKFTITIPVLQNSHSSYNIRADYPNTFFTLPSSANYIPHSKHGIGTPFAVAPSQTIIMPVVLCSTIKVLLPQLNKRDHTPNQEGDDSDAKSPVVVIGLIIAALTLLAAMIPLFRCQRFRIWASSFSIPSFVKKALGIALPRAPPTTTTAVDGLSDIPLTENPMQDCVITYNNYYNIHIVDIRSNTFPCSHSVITREDGRVPQGWESLGRRSPEQAVTWPF
ncbi:hypothetical protein HOY82DRAFT_537718 [Tuber indicum]|nr:hypothetical protein HOY82DRAFT_537718 [Tuber indicum]